ncbi:hypothetical protein OF122_12875 [Pelagibacterium flavum]|uniref:Uncharacterized protein n=1 Tax=Pelagibacterium flavum TaxID=2984530 RepID=A0ABY6IK24_9HYPH|nr:hypothetical protein [Pelagibacterium sp. YIM 151497]UYQ70951.1 hypothetical protein OF122_12875 [Pelagibacterium sp. YIM 151497]
MIPEAVATIAVKFGGAVLGAALALTFQPPKTISGALRRLGLSIPSGMIFHPQLAEWLQWPRNWDNDFAAIVLTSAISWWIFGAIVRVLEVWKGPKG